MMKAIIITIATGQRAIIGEDKALRIHANPYGDEQKNEMWKTITPEQRERLINEAMRFEEVVYDEAQSHRYGRPIWH